MSDKHLIQLVVGDWSDDGHGKTSTVTIESSKSKEDTLRAFILGNKKHKLTNYCSDYGDATIPEELILSLAENLPWNFDEDVSYEDFHATPEEYADLWIAVALSADSELIINQKDMPTLNIGGYGCFI